MRTNSATEDLLQELAPQVLGLLVRRHGQFEACEDAVQEALVAAALGWPKDGVPSNPRGWLITVASRRLIDAIRNDSARRSRETTAALQQPEIAADAADGVPAADDTLILLFLCCHPALTPATQTALTLRAVGGLTTAEIARAFLVPEGTVAARVSRAKQSIRAAGSQFQLPSPQEQAERLTVVLHVLYLIFNEGYLASSGATLQRADLTHEAIRLTRMVHQLLPDDGEVAALLALMLLTESRRAARATPDGDLVPLAEQDRSHWDRSLIDEGTALISTAVTGTALGPYQLQAAIAATHAAADRAEDTDWRQIHGLYMVLERVAPNPMVTLNRSVALAETAGPQAALDLLADLDLDTRMTEHHRLYAVRAHLYERLGDASAARENYLRAAQISASVAERRYLQSRVKRLDDGLG
jgi:RNA polymerase sigma factor (sigma-70 family)